MYLHVGNISEEDIDVLISHQHTFVFLSVKRKCQTLPEGQKCMWNLDKLEYQDKKSSNVQQREKRYYNDTRPDT